MFLFDTGYLLLQESTYTYLWLFYWGFLFLGTLECILGSLVCLRGFRHYPILWGV